MSGHYLKRKGGQPWAEVKCVHCGQMPGTVSLGSFLNEMCPADHDQVSDLIDAIKARKEE